MGKWFKPELDFNKREFMSTFQKVILIGNLCQDVELKHTPSGAAVANMTVATTQNWKNSQGEKQEKTEFSRVVVWGKQAENCNQYLSKGKKVLVEGKLDTRSWEDSEGKKRYTTEIKADNVTFLSSNSATNEALKATHGQVSMNADYSVKTDTDFASDNIPF